MAKQTRIPGTEQNLIKEIVDAADVYEELRDERLEVLKKEGDAKNELLAVMKKNNLTSYNYENKEITITEKEDIKVTSKKIKEKE
jgi:hypothetical protein